MKQMLITISILVTVSCMAQEAPSAVKSAFAKKFPGTTVKKMVSMKPTLVKMEKRCQPHLQQIAQWKKQKPILR